jgi:D-sedoheptulose 7-phosphate isomerase
MIEHQRPTHDLPARIRGYEAAVAWLKDHAQLPEMLAAIYAASFAKGGTVFFCGNGGSAADAQHLAAEYVGRYGIANRRPLRAMALTTDTSILTAVGNDFGYDEVFLRQLQAHLRAHDTIVFHSTSGASPNLVRAAEWARSLYGTTGKRIAMVALLGPKDRCSKSPLAKLVSGCIYAEAPDTASIQMAHMMLQHLVCDVVDHWAMYGVYPKPVIPVDTPADPYAPPPCG